MTCEHLNAGGSMLSRSTTKQYNSTTFLEENLVGSPIPTMMCLTYD